MPMEPQAFHSSGKGLGLNGAPTRSCMNLLSCQVPRCLIKTTSQTAGKVRNIYSLPVTLQERGETKRCWLLMLHFPNGERFSPTGMWESILAYATFGLNFLWLQPGFWPNIHCTSALSLEEQHALSRSEKNVLGE